MDNSVYDDMISDFELHFPEIAKHVVRWFPSGRNEITIRLDDGDKIAYNSLFKTIKRIPQFDDQTPGLSEEMWRRKFGDKIYEIMNERGWSQYELSKRSGISQVSISNYISGKTAPNIYCVTKLAGALGCSITELTEFD